MVLVSLVLLALPKAAEARGDDEDVLLGDGVVATALVRSGIPDSTYAFVAYGGSSYRVSSYGALASDLIRCTPGAASAAGTAQTTSYGWDRNSNRVSVTSAGQTSSTSYRLDNSIASVQPPTGAKQGYVYDDAGRLTSDGCTTNTYDGFDRISKAVTAGTTVCGGDSRTTSYVYDGLDRQREATLTGSTKTGAGGSANGTTRSVFDGLSTTLVGQQDAVAGDGSRAGVLYQLDASGTAVGLKQAGAGAGTSFLDTDGLGNVIAQTGLGSNGSECEVVYDPFGNPVSPQAGASSNGMCASGSKATSTANSLWYRGRARDASTGNYQLGTRSYDPGTGAFTTPDSYRIASPATDLSIGTDPLTANTYSYVNGNPINYWDPTGHVCVKKMWGGKCKKGKDENIFGSLWGALKPIAEYGGHRTKLLAGDVAKYGPTALFAPPSLIQEDLGTAKQLGLHPVESGKAILDGTLGPAADDIAQGDYDGASGKLLAGVLEVFSTRGASKAALGAKVHPPGSKRVPVRDKSGNTTGANSGLHLIEDGAAARQGVPHGFESRAAFREFSSELNRGLTAAGYSDVTAVLQGSAITGVKYTTKVPFDFGWPAKPSDFDIALAGPGVYQRASDLGIGQRGGGTRTGPLDESQLKKLGLLELAEGLSTQASRDVHFMIYRSIEDASKRAPGMVMR